MGAIVFDKLVFDSWLTKKSDEILCKIDREIISTEDMIILLLKAQTNHLRHIRAEFRSEFATPFREVDRSFQKLESFEKIDQRFDHLTKILMVMGAVMALILFT